MIIMPCRVNYDAPILHYRGRNIEINSDGTGVGTHVRINGEEITNIIELTLHISPSAPVNISMYLHDAISSPTLHNNEQVINSDRSEQITRCVPERQEGRCCGTVVTESSHTVPIVHPTESPQISPGYMTGYPSVEPNTKEDSANILYSNNEVIKYQRKKSEIRDII